MGKVKLILYREKALVAGGVSYGVYFDGEKVDSIFIGSNRVYMIDDSKPLTINFKVAGSALAVHKIDDFIIIDPKKSTTKEIELRIGIKINWAGTLTGGWLAKQGDLVFNVNYNYSSSAQNQVGYQGQNQGGFQGQNFGGFQGNTQGGYKGQIQGGYPGQNQGGYQGQYQGGYPGQNQGGNQNQYQGQEPSVPSAPKFCFHCGAKLPEGANFCPGCGTKVG